MTPHHSSSNVFFIEHVFNEMKFNEYFFSGGQAEQIEWKLFVQVGLSTISDGLQLKDSKAH